MAIQPEQMQVRYGDVAVGISQLGITWEMYHPQTDTVIESGSLIVPVEKPAALVQAWERAVGRVETETASVKAKHEPVTSIGGYSLFDADLILDGWLSDPEAETLNHPLSGDYSAVTYSGIVGLVNAVLARVLGPPTWFWAESVEPGKLRVRCVAVGGADSYNVYDGETLLANVPGSGWQTLTVDGGVYSVHMAAVSSGVVGVCSFPVAVEVEAIAGAAPVSLPLMVEPELARGERFKAFMREGFWPW